MNEPSDAWREPLFTVGVTGTNGKTSTTLLIAEILRQAGSAVVSETTLGTSLARDEFEAREGSSFFDRMRRAADGGVRQFVLETTSEALAHGWAKRWRFDMGVFTNLTRDHLDAHGSFEHYLASKAQLFVHLRAGASAVLNAADEAALLIERVTPSSVRRLFYATPERGPALVDAHLQLRSCSLSPEGTLLELEPSELAEAFEGQLQIGLIGAVFAENALAAALAGHAAGASPTAIRHGLRALARVPGRFEVVLHSPCVVVDYAHSEDALARTCHSARELLRQLGGAQLIVVFGAGGERDRDKRKPMGTAVGARADLAIVTNDNPRSEPPEDIARAVLAGVEAGGRARGVVELDRARAIMRALEAAGPHDVVLICGKGHERCQTVGGASSAFDDADCVRRAGSLTRAR